MTVSV
jgi:hypothetical protein